jgi:hypothetical protein
MENKLITLNNLDEYNTATREYIDAQVDLLADMVESGDVSIYFLNSTSSSTAIPVMQKVLNDYKNGKKPVVIAGRASLTDEDAGLFQVGSVGTTSMYLYNGSGISTNTTTVLEYGYPDRIKQNSSFGCTIKCTLLNDTVTEVVFTNDTNKIEYVDRTHTVNKTWFDKEFKPKNLSYIGHYDTVEQLPDNYQTQGTNTLVYRGYFYNFYGLNINGAGNETYYTSLRDSIKTLMSNHPEYGKYFVAFVSRPNSSNKTTCQCFITDYPEQLFFTTTTNTWGISSSNPADNYAGLCKCVYDETKPVYHLRGSDTNNVSNLTPTLVTADMHICPFSSSSSDYISGDGWGYVGYSYCWGRMFLNTNLKHINNSDGRSLKVKHYDEYFTHDNGTWCVGFDPKDNTPVTLTSVLNPVNSIASVGDNNDLYIVNSNYEWEKLIGASAGGSENEEDLKAALDSRYLFFLPNASFNDWGSEENVAFVKERVEHLAKEYGWSNMAFIMAGPHRTANGIFVFKDNPSDNIYRYEKLGAACDYVKHNDSYDSIVDDGHYLKIEINVDTLELVSIGGEYDSGLQRGSFLGTSYDYPTPYTPKYAGSPATKQYVDDAVAGASSSPTCVEFLPNLYYHYNGNMIEASTGCTFTTQKGIATLTKCKKADGTYITKVDCSISLEGSLDTLIGNKYLIDTWFSIGELPYYNTSAGTKVYDVKLVGLTKTASPSLQLFDGGDYSKYLYFCYVDGTDFTNYYADELKTGEFKLYCDITYYTTEE